MTMSPNSAVALLEDFLQRRFLLMHDSAAMPHALLLVLETWTIWRFWKFTIYPKLHPDEPLELPYLVPCK